MKPQIIAFTGSMGVGKSTAINQLDRTSDTVLLKFADPLYEGQRLLYRIIKDVYPTPEPLKDRKLLQWLGTEWGRGLSPTLWVDLWRSKAFRALGSGKVVLVDDCRFDNEAEAIHALGGRVVRVIGKTNKRNVARAGIEKHASEAGVSDKWVHRTIENNGKLEAFKDKIDDLWTDFRAGKL